MKVEELMQITIEEVARIALEDEQTRRHICHELGLTEAWAKEVHAYLEDLVEKDRQEMGEQL